MIVPDSNYFSLADPKVRSLAEADLRGWLESLPTGSAVDEYQLIPYLRLTMKLIVDERNARPGQFLLTGSAVAPDDELGGTAALAGRQLSYRVDPFAQCELEGTPRDSLRALFEVDPREFVVDSVNHEEFRRRFAGGGLLLLRNASLNELPRAIDDYLRGLFGAGIRETSRDRDALLRLFHVVAASSSKLENISDLAQKLELSRETVRGYLNEFLNVFTIVTSSAYRSDPAKRVTDKRRVYVSDPLFVAQASGVGPKADLFDSVDGAFVETAIFNEVSRLKNWTTVRGLRLQHWRMNNKHEVDIVLEGQDGRSVAIEIKAARSVGLGEAKGIRAFRERYPTQFHRGFVLHCGDRVHRLDENIWAVPFSVLWMVGEPVTPRLGSGSLADKLITARDRIQMNRTATANAANDTQALWESRRANAIEKLDLAATLLIPVVESLTEIGLDPILNPASDCRSSDSIVWEGSRSVSFTHGRATLYLQARVDVSELNEIAWMVNLSDAQHSEAFGDPLVTKWDQNPLPEIEYRLGLFADRLPTRLLDE